MSNQKKKSKKKTAQLMKRIQILLMVIIGIAIVAVLFVLYQDLPAIRAARSMRRAEKYQAAGSYEEAAVNYADAVSYNIHNSLAYESLAQCYLSLGDNESAKKALYDGYKNTGEEVLFDSYLTLCLNESVRIINAGNADLDMVDEVVRILAQAPDNEQALEILSSAYAQVLFADGEEEESSGGANTIFTFGAEGDAAFSQYQEILQAMLDVYEKNPNDSLGEVILQYAMPYGTSVHLQLANAAEYQALVEDAMATVDGASENQSLTSFLDCLSTAQTKLALFDDFFTELDEGNLEASRDFLTGSVFASVKGSFVNETNGVWENTVEIPVSREGIILTQTSDGWQFRYMDFDDYQETDGVITLWTRAIVDSERENLQLTYEPAEEVPGVYYPHTLYTVTYQYSNVASGSVTSAMLNYRLDTTIYAEDGTTTKTTIGDWGGPNEYTMDFDNLSHLSKK